MRFVVFDDGRHVREAQSYEDKKQESANEYSNCIECGNDILLLERSCQRVPTVLPTEEVGNRIGVTPVRPPN